MNACEAPHFKSVEVENFVMNIFTWSLLLDRFDLNQSITSRANPNVDIFRSNIL